MPQLQLPIFPAGVTEINSRIAVQKEGGRVFYLHGHLPVFQHEEQDVRGFRMFTSQMIAGGTVKPKEIVQTFGVPMITVSRCPACKFECRPLLDVLGVEPGRISGSLARLLALLAAVAPYPLAARLAWLLLGVAISPMGIWRAAQ